MTQTLRVVQAFDRTLVAEVAADDGDALENKLVAAAEAMRNRDGWLKPHQRSAVLQRAASLLEARQEPFVTLIAREGGKPATRRRCRGDTSDRRLAQRRGSAPHVRRPGDSHGPHAGE